MLIQKYINKCKRGLSYGINLVIFKSRMNGIFFQLKAGFNDSGRSRDDSYQRPNHPSHPQPISQPLNCR